jgi:hypothetical protein
VKGFLIVAALGIVAPLVGCGQVAPPQGATPVHFTVLTKQGALEDGIFAATSVDDLRSQEMLIGPPPLKTCTAANGYGCFAKFSTPPESLLVAMRPMACADSRLDTAYLKDGTLTFVITWSNRCPTQYRAAAVPQDFVVAVQLHALPQKLLPLQLDFSDGGKPAEVVGRGLVDLRAPGPGRTRSGNFTLEAAPLVVKGQAERITLTVFGLPAVRRYSYWKIDIAALDHAGRVVRHQDAYHDPTIFKCLVGEVNRCPVGSFSVEMPTLTVPTGVYTIRPSFFIPTSYVPTPPEASSPPPFPLPSLTVEIAAA